MNYLVRYLESLWDSFGADAEKPVKSNLFFREKHYGARAVSHLGQMKTVIPVPVESILSHQIVSLVRYGVVVKHDGHVVAEWTSAENVAKRLLSEKRKNGKDYAKALPVTTSNIINKRRRTILKKGVHANLTVFGINDLARSFRSFFDNAPMLNDALFMLNAAVMKMLEKSAEGAAYDPERPFEENAYSMLGRDEVARLPATAKLWRQGRLSDGDADGDTIDDEHPLSSWPLKKPLALMIIMGRYLMTLNHPDAMNDEKIVLAHALTGIMPNRLSSTLGKRTLRRIRNFSSGDVRLAIKLVDEMLALRLVSHANKRDIDAVEAVNQAGRDILTTIVEAHRICPVKYRARLLAGAWGALVIQKGITNVDMRDIRARLFRLLEIERSMFMNKDRSPALYRADPASPLTYNFINTIQRFHDLRDMLIQIDRTLGHLEKQEENEYSRRLDSIRDKLRGLKALAFLENNSVVHGSWLDLKTLPFHKWKVEDVRRGLFLHDVVTTLHHEISEIKMLMRENGGIFVFPTFSFMPEKWDNNGIRFERIPDELRLLRTGQRMNHCVFSYNTRCMNGEYVVYRVFDENGTEYTLGIDMTEGEPKFDQMYGSGNTPAPTSVMDAAQQLLARIRKEYHEHNSFRINDFALSPVT